MVSKPAQSATRGSGSQPSTEVTPNTTPSTKSSSASAATTANRVGITISAPAGNTILNASSAITTTGTNDIGNPASMDNPSVRIPTGTNDIRNADSPSAGSPVNSTSNTPSASATTGQDGPNGTGNAVPTPMGSPPNTTSSNLSMSGTADTNVVGIAISPPANGFSHIATEIQRFHNLTKFEEIYNDAVERVLAVGSGKGLSEEEIQLITSKRDIESFQQDIKNEIEKTARWESQKHPFFRGAKKTSEFLERFSEAIGTLVSIHPMIAAPIWCGLRSLMVIAKEIFETYESLVKLATQTQFVMKRFKKYMDSYGIEPIKEELLYFHTQMIKFCLHARKVYKMKGRKLGPSVFRSSLSAPFDDLLKSINRAADEVEKSANAEHMVRSEALLQRVLRKENPPVLATQTTKKQHIGKLRSAQHFTGRDDVLGHLRSSFAATRIPDRPHTAALYGLPGVGKSQTAIRYAEQSSEDSHPYTFFVRSESEENLLSDFRTIAYRLRILDKSSDLKDPLYVEKIFEWLENTPNWLIVFDNVIDLPTIQKWIPRSGTGDILYTTRNPVLAENLVEETSRAFEVQPLKIGWAIDLANRLRNDLNPPPEIEALIRQLCEELGCLPMAINQAIELTRSHEIPLATMIKDLRRKRNVLRQQHLTSRHESNLSVWALYLLAMETVESKYPEAGALMNTLIYFDTTSIPLEMIKAGGSKLNAHFKRDVIYPRGSIHDNSAQTSKTRQKAKVTQAPATRTFLGWQFSLPTRAPPSPTPEPSPLPPPALFSTSDSRLFTFYHSNEHLQALLANSSHIDNEINNLRAAGLLKLARDDTIWIHDLVRDIFLEHIAETSPSASDSRAYLPLTMVYLSFPEPSLMHYSAIYNRGLSHQPHALATLHHCSRFLSDCTIGPELMHMVASFFHVRSERESRSWLDEAVKYYDLAHTGYFAAWKRQRLHLHSSSSSSSMTSADMSIALAEREAYDLEASYRYILTYYRIAYRYERFGGPLRRLLDTAIKLACILHTSNPLLAITWASEALRGYASLFGDTHDLTFHAMGLEIQLYLDTQQYNAGLPVMLRMLDASEIRVGSPQLSAEGAECCANMGHLLEGLHEYEEAISWFESARSGREATSGPDTPELTGTIVAIGTLHEKLHHHQQAIDLFVRSRTLCEKWDSEPGVARARFEMVTSLLRIGRSTEALVELRWVCARLRRIHLGSFEDAKDIFRSMWLRCAWNFALARLVIGEDIEIPSDFGGDRLDEAEALFGKVELCNGCSSP